LASEDLIYLTEFKLDQSADKAILEKFEGKPAHIVPLSISRKAFSLRNISVTH